MAVLVFSAQAEAISRHAYLHKTCSNDRPRACVSHAIRHNLRWMQGWQRRWMYRVPGCESTWQPWVTSSGGHMGLFQFAPGTWAGLRYRGRSAYDAKWASLAAVLMVKQGRTSEWSCG